MTKYITTIDGENYEVELLEDNKITVNGEPLNVDFEEVSGQRIYTILVNGKSFEVHVSEDDLDWKILIRGTLYHAEVVDEREKRLRDAAGEGQTSSGEYVLKSPMPGLVVKIPVNEGDEIEKGAVLIILESMKMQNELKSPQAGVVTFVGVQEGDSVEQRETLVIVNPPPESEEK